MRLILCFLLTLCALCHADDKAETNTVVLPAGTVHKGDYFVTGGGIEISGTVEGDVYAAGSQIFIDGNVMGDVLAVGGTVQVSGHVMGNVRILAGQVNLSGKIGRNATLVSGNADLFPSGNVGGNLVIVSGNADMASTVGLNATIMASNIRIASVIKNQLQAYVGVMRLTSKADIGGSVEYSSSTEALIDSRARIGGQLIHHPSLFEEILHGNWMRGVLLGSKVAAVMMNFLYTLMIGWILIRLMPKNLSAALHALERKPWKSLGAGIMLLILLPLASLILLMTVLGAPFALTLIALNIIGFYTAKIYSIMWVSNWLFTKVGLAPNKMPILCVGLVAYFILTSIPFFGIVLAFAAMLFGLGAGTLAQTKKLHVRRT